MCSKALGANRSIYNDSLQKRRNFEHITKQRTLVSLCPLRPLWFIKIDKLAKHNEQAIFNLSFVSQPGQSLF